MSVCVGVSQAPAVSAAVDAMCCCPAAAACGRGACDWTAGGVGGEML